MSTEEPTRRSTSSTNPPSRAPSDVGGDSGVADGMVKTTVNDAPNPVDQPVHEAAPCVDRMVSDQPSEEQHISAAQPALENTITNKKKKSKKNNTMVEDAATQPAAPASTQPTPTPTTTIQPDASSASSPEELRAKAATLRAGWGVVGGANTESLPASPAGGFMSSLPKEEQEYRASLVGSARDSIDMAYNTHSDGASVGMGDTTG